MTLAEVAALKVETWCGALGFFPEGKPSAIWLALGDGRVLLLSPSLRVQNTTHLGLFPLNDAFYSEFARSLVGAGNSGVRIYDLESNEVFNPCIDLNDNLYKVTPSQEMKVICGGSDEVLLSLDLANGFAQELVYLGEQLNSISIHPDGQHILYTSGASGCYSAFLDSNLKETLVCILEMQRVTAWFTPTGQGILQCDEYLRLFEFPSLKIRWCFSERDGFIPQAPRKNWNVSRLWSNVVFSHNGNEAFCGSPTGKIYCLDLETAKVKVALDAHDGGVTNLAMSQDGKMLLSMGADKIARLWRIEV